MARCAVGLVLSVARVDEQSSVSEGLARRNAKLISGTIRDRHTGDTARLGFGFEHRGKSRIAVQWATSDFHTALAKRCLSGVPPRWSLLVKKDVN
jgi:hypothetical protein